MLTILVDKYFRHDAQLKLVCVIEGDANWALCNDLARRIAIDFGKLSPESGSTRFLYDTSATTGKHYVGVHTSDQMKHTMVQGIQLYMSFSKMCISPDFFTTSLTGKETILAQLKKEMKQFMATPSKANPSHTLYSGKGDEKMLNDDVAMAFMLGIHWARQHMLGNTPAIPWNGGGRAFEY